MKIEINRIALMPPAQYDSEIIKLKSIFRSTTFVQYFVFVNRSTQGFRHG